MLGNVPVARFSASAVRGATVDGGWAARCPHNPRFLVKIYKRLHLKTEQHNSDVTTTVDK